MNPYQTAHSPAENLRCRECGTLETSLESFTRRFPVSGRIIEALAEEEGGLLALADAIEANGHIEHARIWIAEGNPHPLRPENVRNIFEPEKLDRIAEKLAIPRESVEVQAALSLPKFFATLAHENNDGLDFGYSMSPKADQKHAHVDTVAGRTNPGVNPGLKIGDIDSDAAETA
jgi:uncharacterized protein YidB (DUF937 family)